ncbi:MULTISPECIES: hypothetical protein [Ectothiorhodospira]|uniref:hypothetical protein n=1 Tax=Ectothiorhodospira TaxID=1051 RepID=UPI001902E887|nr:MULTISPECIES: hypothetical protein [Ectothiorhodospira]MCG5501298.1 hypothetical protein [Ectothiorhodospira lacustris]
MSYTETRKRLLESPASVGKVLGQMRGHYVVLVSDALGITLHQDSLGILRIYGLDSGDFFASSFLATAWACPGKLELNQVALGQKIATGEIFGSETLFKQVVRCEPGRIPGSAGATRGVAIRRPEQVTMPERGSSSLAESLDENAELLGSRLMEAEQAASDGAGLLGVSAGYDSRLLLAASIRGGLSISLFTHNTMGVHTKEHGVVDKIGMAMGLVPEKYSSKRLEELDREEVEAVADDCLHFFDGCSSRQRGALQETFTQKYYRRVFSGHSVFFNGLGGEIFRNHTGTRNGKVDVHDWMERHVFFPFGPALLRDREHYKVIRQSICETVSQRLGIQFEGAVSLTDLRRFYSEIRVPDSDANILNAHNQLVYVNAPFTEKAVIAGGLAATPHIGLGGEYEAALIKRLMPKLGDIVYNDGYVPRTTNLQYHLRNHLRAIVPDRMAINRIRRRSQGVQYHAVEAFGKLKKIAPLFQDIEEVLLEILPDDRFHLALLHNSQRPATLYLGLVLLHFRDRIRW